ncbi:MAG: hypothetical protein ABI840_09080 [bacterium]
MRHKALDIFRTFSENDVKAFSKFLKSPFFNESEKLYKLYDILISFYPSFNSDLLTDKLISERLSPNLAYKQSTIKVLFSDLYNCSLNYLTVKNLMSNQFESQDMLRNELFSRNLFRSVEENITKFETSGKINENINVLYFLNMFQFYTDKSNLIYLKNSKKNKTLINQDIDALTRRGVYLTYFFVMEFMREFDNLMSIGATYDFPKSQNIIYKLFNALDFESLFDLLIRNESNKNYSTVLKIYHSLYLTFMNFDTEKFYYEYKKLVLNNLNLLSADEKRFHISRMLKYCMQKRDNGIFSEKFDNELFYVYDFLLNKGYYRSTVTEFFPDELFRNILKLGLKLKKYNWVKGFIKNYVKRLIPDRRKNMHNFSLAEYYFNRKMFKESLNYLHKVLIEDFIFKLDIKNMMLITYFELKEFDAGLSLIDSYNHFLSGDKTLSSNQKIRYKNFVNATQKLIQLKTSVGKHSTIELELRLKNDFPYKQWVNEKLNVIMEGLSKAV